MQENNENQQPQNAAAQDIDKEIEIVAEQAKPKKESVSVKAWLVLLFIVFAGSMASGLYLAVTGAAAPKKPAIKLDIEEESSTLLDLASKKQGAAVIKINGIIQETGERGFGSKQNASAIAKKIRAAADKKQVTALLLDINSPGGTVASVQDIYDAVLYFKSKKKPVVAMFRDVAASGGFYVAMAADKIVAQPGTLTGSIGVIMQGSNIEGLFDKIGVKMTPIKSGKHKDMGSPYRQMTEEEQALLQEMINDTYQQFFAVVQKARPNIPVEQLKLYADGRIFTGQRAKAIGMIDELGGEETARQILGQMTGNKDIKLLTPKINNFFEAFSISAALNSKLGFDKLEEITTPKVSYLWTTL